MTEGIHYARPFEAAVLGIFMIEATAFGRTMGLIDETVFYFDDNAKVYTVIKEMYDRSQPVDEITVWQRIIEKGVTLHAGDMPTDIAYYLTGLTRNVVNSTALEYQCWTLKEMWRRRELIRLKNLPETGHETHEQIKNLSRQLSSIQAAEFQQDWFTMDELMFDLLKHQQEIAAGTKEFITTGFKAVDKVNGGFSGGQMIVLGARPGVGKSAIMGKMALSIAMKTKKVGIISLEMNNTEIAARLASLETDFDFNTIYRNLFTDENQQTRFYNIISKKTAHLPIFVSSKTKVDVHEIKSKALKLKYQHGIDVLMVDYLQLVDGTTSNKNYNREQEVSKISRGLKLLAMEMNIPVIVLCQLNRGTTQSKDPKHRYPALHNLRESGAIEQDADIVAMLHRDWLAGFLSDENGNSTENQADILFLKWRNGAPLHLGLDFDPPKMKFSEKPYSNLQPIKLQQQEVEEDEPF